MSTKYVILEREPERPGCFGWALLSGLVIGVIYGIYRLIRWFVEWVTSLNPYSIVIFFAALLLIAGIVFLSILLYKLLKYKSIRQCFDNLKDDLLNIEDIYQGQKSDLKELINSHADAYQKLPGQIDSCPELGINKKDFSFTSDDGNDFEKYVNDLRHLSKAIEAKGRLLPNNSLDEEAYERVVEDKVKKLELKYFHNNELFQELELNSRDEFDEFIDSHKQYSVKQYDKDIERIESYSGQTKAKVLADIDDVAHGEGAINRFQHVYYRVIKEFLEKYYDKVVRHFKKQTTICISLGALCIGLIGGIVMLNFARVDWDMEKEIITQQAKEAEEQAQADKMAKLEAAKKEQEFVNKMDMIGKKLESNIELELKNEEFGIVDRPGMINKTHSQRTYPKSMSSSDFAALKQCSKNREKCCELSHDNYMKEVVEYKKQLIALTFSISGYEGHSDFDVRVFDTLDDRVSLYISSARINNYVVKNHLVNEEINRLNLYQDGTNSLYYIWMLSNIGYAIKDCYPDIYNMHPDGKSWEDYEAMATRYLDQFNTRFESTNVECNSTDKNTKLKPVGKKSNSYKKKKEAIYLI